MGRSDLKFFFVIGLVATGAYWFLMGEFKGKTMTGIYEIKGDTMRVCFAGGGKDRPTEFRTKEGSMEMLVTYKRIKP